MTALSENYMLRAAKTSGCLISEAENFGAFNDSVTTRAEHCAPRYRKIRLPILILTVITLKRYKKEHKFL